MDNVIQCKSCNYTITMIEKECPNCGISSPMKKSNKKLYVGIALFIILIVVIPMVASLLWMK